MRAELWLPWKYHLLLISLLLLSYIFNVWMNVFTRLHFRCYGVVSIYGERPSNGKEIFFTTLNILWIRTEDYAAGICPVWSFSFLSIDKLAVTSVRLKVNLTKPFNAWLHKLIWRIRGKKHNISAIKNWYEDSVLERWLFTGHKVYTHVCRSKTDIAWLSLAH